MAFFLTFFGAIFSALAITLNAKAVREGVAPKNRLSPNVALGGSYVTTSLYLWVLFLILWLLDIIHFPTSSVFWGSLAITVVINVIMESWRFRSYQTADLSLVAPFAGIAPVLSILTAWIILGELPTLAGGIGIGIIAFSLYFLYLQGPFRFKTFFKPLRTVWENPGSRLAFLSSIPPALSIVFDKKAVLAADPISFSACAFLLIGLISLVFDFFKEKEKTFITQMSSTHLKNFFKIGFLHFVSVAAMNSALLFDVVPHVSALRRISIVFEVLFAYFLLNQKTDIKRRFVGSLGVLVGIILIAVIH